MAWEEDKKLWLLFGYDSSQGKTLGHGQSNNFKFLEKQQRGLTMSCYSFISIILNKDTTSLIRMQNVTQKKNAEKYDEIPVTYI
jgi:hypothetical protein